MKQLESLVKIIFLSGIFFSSFTVRSQDLSRNTSKEDLINYSENIRQRMKNIPSNEFQIYEELKWVNIQLSELINLKQLKDNNEATIIKMNGLKKQFDLYLTKLQTFNCQSSDYESIYTQLWTLASQLDRFIFDYDLDETDEWTRIEIVLAPIAQFRQNGLKQGDCGKFKTDLLKNKFPLLMDSLFYRVTIEANRKSMERKDKIGMVNTVETDLNAYKQILIDAQSKLKTKENLGSNLYIMILIIGGLSVLAFGMVRMFPESVMLEWVVSGQVIQFVTVMILLSCIMALGLSGLIGENTLGTLLGGVAGYVLSQGIAKSQAKVIKGSSD